MSSYLIDHSNRGLRLAKIQQGRVVAFDFELKNQPPRYHHAVFKGKVVDVSKQMAFVDIGLDQPGVLPMKERNFPPVNRGESVLVQVTREADPKEGKGVHLSRNISLALGPMIYTPFTPGLNVSKRLKSDLFTLNLNDDEGLILRHWADRFDQATLDQLLEHLRKAWSNVKAKEVLTPPTLLEKLISQLEPGDQIECNHRPTGERLTQMLLDTYGGGPEIELTRESPFDDNIEDQWDSLTETHVVVPGGGELIIEQTSALVSIDVNMGGAHLTGHDLNRRALKEAFHQIELRNLAGIILIDLAGNIKHPKQLIQSARGHANSDTHVHGITDLGLLEISRRKSGPSLTEQLIQIGE